MPIEIRELIIEAKLAATGERPKESSLVTVEDLEKFKAEIAAEIITGSGPNSRAFRREMIEACLEAVREMLDNEKRR